MRRLLALLAVSCFLVTCGSGYRYQSLTSVSPGRSEKVEIVSERPSRPFTEIMHFRGTETGLCKPGEAYCSLRQKAMEAGADAIWIQRTDTYTRPARTLIIDGRATVIPSAQYDTVDGVFVRYTQ